MRVARSLPKWAAKQKQNDAKRAGKEKTALKQQELCGAGRRVELASARLRLSRAYGNDRFMQFPCELPLCIVSIQEYI